MRRKLFVSVLLVLIGSSPHFNLTWAQDEAAKDDEAKAESVQRLARMKRTVDHTVLTVGEASDKLVRIEEPVQRWSNPVARIVDASVFVWTRDERPMVVAQVAFLGRGGWTEYQSLTTEPLEGRNRGHKYWSPSSAGIEWMRAPTSEPPAKTAELRRVQMRRIAEKFQISDIFALKDRNQLRLLPSPLYRYSAPKAGVVDGALFSFALGTDPEVMLLIESQKVENVDTWMLAFARLTGYECEATLDGKVVWSCKAVQSSSDPDGTFCSVGGID